MAELEAERQRAREFQSRYDQLQSSLSSGGGQGAGGAGASDGAGDGGFDPESFRQSLLRDVLSTQSMVSAASTLRAEFPHADPALFTPDRLSQFRNPEALRFAVEDSHRRVAGIIDAERAAIEQRIREELAASNGAGGAGPAGTPPASGGDPTPEQLLAMDLDEWDRLEELNPGVVERVLAKAQATS